MKAPDVQPTVGSQTQILWVKGPDGTTEYIDARGAALIGRSAEEICGLSWFDLLHPDDVATARREWQAAVRQRRSYETEFRLGNAVGKYRWMVERGSPVFAREGTILRWVGTLTDVEIDRQAREHHQETEKEANETRALLETLQSSAPIGFLFVDRQFRYVRVNEKVAAIHGSSSVQEHLGRTVAEVVPKLVGAARGLLRRGAAHG